MINTAINTNAAVPSVRFLDIMSDLTTENFNEWKALCYETTMEELHGVLETTAMSAYVKFVHNGCDNHRKQYHLYLAVFNSIRRRPMLANLLAESGITAEMLRRRMKAQYSFIQHDLWREREYKRLVGDEVDTFSKELDDLIDSLKSSVDDDDFLKQLDF